MPMPDPRADQLFPSHLATEKSPPAYRLVPDTASARTVPEIPEPTALQLLPFHLAML